jgi:6-pyruvoyltetrahydropterin/6-carboxytetrahydropterin synthase
MTTIQTQETFPAAHFVQTADKASSCRNLHGHTWKVIVNIEGKVQKDGMLIDFRHIKGIIKLLDHKTLIPEILDPEEDAYISKNWVITTDYNLYSIPKSDVIILPIDAVTAENLAKYFMKKITEHLECGCLVTVTVYESENSFAEETQLCE